LGTLLFQILNFQNLHSVVELNDLFGSLALVANAYFRKTETLSRIRLEINSRAGRSVL
jgi:hypothetical protein